MPIFNSLYITTLQLYLSHIDMNNPLISIQFVVCQCRVSCMNPKVHMWVTCIGVCQNSKHYCVHGSFVVLLEFWSLIELLVLIPPPPHQCHLSLHFPLKGEASILEKTNEQTNIIIGFPKSKSTKITKRVKVYSKIYYLEMMYGHWF